MASTIADTKKNKVVIKTILRRFIILTIKQKNNQNITIFIMTFKLKKNI